jgi:hypothetical protein
MGTNLLLLDSYKNIEDLIVYSLSFSNRLKRDLEIIYVFDFEWMLQSFMIGSAGPLDPKLLAVEKNAKKEFDVAKAKISEIATSYTKENPVDISFGIHVSELNRVDLVKDEAENIPELILLISNHQSYSEASGGMVGYPNLVEHVGCPVFVIPENISQPVMKNVVYASNYHPEDFDFLKHLSSLMEDAGDATITVLHNEKDYDFGEKLKWKGYTQLAKEEVGYEKLKFILKTKKDMVAAIDEYAGESNPDVLVILNEKRGFFEEIFSRSRTKSVLTHFHKPVLVYHEHS